MFMARVVGEVISTHRHEHLGEKKLLLLRRTSLDGAEEGSEIIALDVIGVGVGEHVLVVQEGNAARSLFKDSKIPVQAVVVGVIDHYDVERAEDLGRAEGRAPGVEGRGETR
jgi:ethanolamine utilization protein EutN